jgi:hypothetical protein
VILGCFSNRILILEENLIKSMANSWESRKSCERENVQHALGQRVGLWILLWHVLQDVPSGKGGFVTHLFSGMDEKWMLASLVLFLDIGGIGQQVPMMKVFSFVDGQLMSKKTAVQQSVQQSVLLCRPRRL